MSMQIAAIDRSTWSINMISQPISSSVMHVQAANSTRRLSLASRDGLRRKKETVTAIWKLLTRIVHPPLAVPVVNEIQNYVWGTPDAIVNRLTARLVQFVTFKSKNRQISASFNPIEPMNNLNQAADFSLSWCSLSHSKHLSQSYARSNVVFCRVHVFLTHSTGVINNLYLDIVWNTYPIARSEALCTINSLMASA